MKKQKLCGTPDVLILVAPYFDVTAVVYCVTLLRQHGLAVTLVSNKGLLINGLNNITLQSDVVLAQAQDLVSDKQQLLVIAGGRESAATALADPRVHQLAQGILSANGYVGIMSNTHYLAADTGLLKPEWAERFLQQGRIETAVFVQRLIQLAAA